MHRKINQNRRLEVWIQQVFILKCFFHRIEKHNSNLGQKTKQNIYFPIDCWQWFFLETFCNGLNQNTASFRFTATFRTSSLGTVSHSQFTYFHLLQNLKSIVRMSEVIKGCCEITSSCIQKLFTTTGMFINVLCNIIYPILVYAPNRFSTVMSFNFL